MSQMIQDYAPITDAVRFPRAAKFDEGPNVPGALQTETSHLRIPSRPEWIVPTVDFLTQRFLQWGACLRHRGNRVSLALHEALTNAIVHGSLELSSDLKEQDDAAFAEALAARAADPQFSSRPVDIHTTYDGSSCRWTVTDQGNGFDVSTVLARAISRYADVSRLSGRGMVLMQAFVDELHYTADGRRVELVIYRTGGEQRQHPHLSADDTASIAPSQTNGAVDWDSAYEALSRNLSADGMDLLQLRLAASPRVLIGLNWEGEVLYMPAEIRHCEPQGEGMMQLGCRFQGGDDLLAAAQRVPGDDVEAAVSELLSQLDGQVLAPNERRAHQRLVYTERIGIRGGPGPTVGFARNLSKGGISFLAHQVLPLEYRILSLPARNGAALRLRALVIRCLPLMDGVFEIGARFEGLDR